MTQKIYPDTFKLRISSLLRSVVVLCVLVCAVSCAGRGAKSSNSPRPLKAREILALVDAESSTAMPEITGVSVQQSGMFTESPRTVSPGVRDAQTGGWEESCPALLYSLQSPSSRVPAKLLTAFGFTFTLKGVQDDPLMAEEGFRNETNFAAPLVMRLSHPPIHNPVTGAVTTSRTQLLLGCLGRPVFAGWRFESDWELVNGRWRVELLYGRRKLAEREFLIYGGQAPSVAPSTVLAQRAQDSQPGVALGAPPASDLRIDLSPGAPSSKKTKALAKREQPVMKAEQTERPVVRHAAAPAPAPKSVPVVAAKPKPAPRVSPTTTPAQQSNTTQTVALPSRSAQGPFAVFVSSNRIKSNAQYHAERLRAKGYPVVVSSYREKGRGLWHTVMIPGFSSEHQARKAASVYMANEGMPAYVMAGKRARVTPAPAASQSAPAGSQHAPVASAQRPAEPKPAPVAAQGKYVIQLSANLEREYAQYDVQRLREKGYAPVIRKQFKKGRNWHTVLLEGYATKAQAAEAARRFMEVENRPAYIFRAP